MQFHFSLFCDARYSFSLPRHQTQRPSFLTATWVWMHCYYRHYMKLGVLCEGGLWINNGVGCGWDNWPLSLLLYCCCQGWFIKYVCLRVSCFFHLFHITHLNSCCSVSICSEKKTWFVRRKCTYMRGDNLHVLMEVRRVIARVSV